MKNTFRKFSAEKDWMINGNNMAGAFDFFIASMPASRPADYYLGCLDGSVFIDFDSLDNGRILLKRISFDGYGCCEIKNKAVPMDEIDSAAFKEIIAAEFPDQLRLTEIVKKTIAINRGLIWEDALNEYDL